MIFQQKIKQLPETEEQLIDEINNGTPTCYQCIYSHVTHQYSGEAHMRDTLRCLVNPPQRNDEDYYPEQVQHRPTVCGQFKQNTSLQDAIDSIDWHRTFKAMEYKDIHHYPEGRKHADTALYTEGFVYAADYMRRLHQLLKEKGYRVPDMSDKLQVDLPDFLR